VSGTIGTRRRVAFALAVMGLPIVHRNTIRAMLPPGMIVNYGLQQHLTRQAKATGVYGGGGKNVTTKRFQTALWEFEREGWITRGEEFVLVNDRRMLLDYALDKITDPAPAHFVDITAAAARLRTEIEDARCRPSSWTEQRRRELIVIKRLMEEDFGSGKGRVRLLPRSKPL
jgi:hypothetical protein